MLYHHHQWIQHREFCLNGGDRKVGVRMLTAPKCISGVVVAERSSCDGDTIMHNQFEYCNIS